MRYHAKLAIAVSAASLMAVASQAHAHAVINEQAVPAGEFTFAALRITHGCDGSPTRAVRMMIPAGVTRVSPRYLSDWKVEKKVRKLAQATRDDTGQEITEVTEKVVWHSGTLPDGYYGEFQIRARMPDTPGRTLWFKTVQDCTDGQLRWTNVPDDDSQIHTHRRRHRHLSACLNDAKLNNLTRALV